MGRQSSIKAKRRELRSYVETRAITPAEANEAMRRAKGRSMERQGARPALTKDEVLRKGY